MCAVALAVDAINAANSMAQPLWMCALVNAIDKLGAEVFLHMLHNSVLQALAPLLSGSRRGSCFLRSCASPLDGG